MSHVSRSLQLTLASLGLLGLLSACGGPTAPVLPLDPAGPSLGGVAGPSTPGYTPYGTIGTATDLLQHEGPVGVTYSARTVNVASAEGIPGVVNGLAEAGYSVTSLVAQPVSGGFTLFAVHEAGAAHRFDRRVELVPADPAGLTLPATDTPDKKSMNTVVRELNDEGYIISSATQTDQGYVLVAMRDRALPVRANGIRVERMVGRDLSRQICLWQGRGYRVTAMTFSESEHLYTVFATKICDDWRLFETEVFSAIGNELQAKLCKYAARGFIATSIVAGTKGGYVVVMSRLAQGRIPHRPYQLSFDVLAEEQLGSSIERLGLEGYFIPTAAVSSAGYVVLGFR